MKKKLSIYLFMVLTILLFTSQLSAEYGHISYVEPDSQVYVERLNGKKDKAIINLPIVPGDKIISAGESRCEIQFNNGTLIRLDHNTILEIVTIKAETLTTRKVISTLELSEGAIYVMAKAYNNEIFQIKTNNTAALFKKPSISILQHRNKNTDLNIFKGTINIIYGKDIKSIKEGRIKSKFGYTINAKNILSKNKYNYSEDFLKWNKDINKNFDKLHKGISKVPKPIFRFSKGIIDWATKWSSAYGEWVYDEIFGYVWSPHDRSFAYAHRPFYGAEFKNINGKLFLVPSQKWGWAPSQLGTWVFMNNAGWRWIPGNAFSGGIFPYEAQFATYLNSHDNYLYKYQQDVNYWIDVRFGDMDLYYIYRVDGKKAWENAYYAKFGRRHDKKTDPPAQVKKLIAKLNRTYVSKIKKSIGKPRKISKSNLQFKNIKQTSLSKPINIGSRFKTVQKLKSPARFKRSVKNKLIKSNFKDFNPDTRWALKKNVNVLYSSKTNKVTLDNISVYRKLISKKGGYNGSSSKSGSYSRGSSGTSSRSSQSSAGGSSSKQK